MSSRRKITKKSTAPVVPPHSGNQKEPNGETSLQNQVVTRSRSIQNEPANNNRSQGRRQTPVKMTQSPVPVAIPPVVENPAPQAPVRTTEAGIPQAFEHQKIDEMVTLLLCNILESETSQNKTRWTCL
jgi:hypothetical protein